MMAGDDKETVALLRKLDRLVTSKSATVSDLLEQAIVASEIADEPFDHWHDVGPLEIMYSELTILMSTVNRLQTEISGMRQSSYENVTWTNTNTTWTDPLRNYPHGYQWDPISKTPIKITTGTGT
jgi:hypothetical protein